VEPSKGDEHGDDEQCRPHRPQHLEPGAEEQEDEPDRDVDEAARRRGLPFFGRLHRHDTLLKDCPEPAGSRAVDVRVISL
jgi:hypothetical protein